MGKECKQIIELPMLNFLCRRIRTDEKRKNNGSKKTVNKTKTKVIYVTFHLSYLPFSGIDYTWKLET